MALSFAAVIYLLSITFTLNFRSNNAGYVAEYVWEKANVTSTSCVNDISLKNSDCSLNGRTFCGGNRAVVFFTEENCLQCHSNTETFSNRGDNTGGYREANSIGLGCSVCLYGPAKSGEQCRDYGNDTVLTQSSGRQIGYLSKDHVGRTAAPMGITPIAYFSMYPRSTSSGALKFFWKLLFLNAVSTLTINRRRDEYSSKTRAFRKSMPSFYDSVNLNKELLQSFGFWDIVWCGDGKCFFDSVTTGPIIGITNLTLNVGFAMDMYDTGYLCLGVQFYSIGDGNAKFSPGCFIKEKNFAISLADPYTTMKYNDLIYNSYRPFGLAGYIRLNLDQVNRLEYEINSTKVDSEHVTTLESVLEPPIIANNETQIPVTVKPEHMPINETAIINIVESYFAHLSDVKTGVDDAIEVVIETVKTVDNVVVSVVNKTREIEKEQTRMQKNILAVIGGASAIVFACFTTLLVFVCYLFWGYHKKQERYTTSNKYGRTTYSGSTTGAFG